MIWRKSGAGPRVRNAKKTTLDVDGRPHTFPSKAEARRYLELKQMQKAGIVKEIELQPEFILQDKYRKCLLCPSIYAEGRHGRVICHMCGGKMRVVRAIIYCADFRITYSDGHQEIEDVKGMETEIFKLKRKMFEYKYPELTLIVRKV